MSKITKKLQQNKKSIFSAVLAFILMLSFNYSPISLIANSIKSANAYTSSSLQEYYANTTTSSESKIGSANYPAELEKYFKNSSNNFNIQTYYNDRYLDLFAEYVHEYLANDRADNATYKAAYLKFLEVKKAKTLFEYFENDLANIKASYGCETFISYVEYFVHNKTDWILTPDNQGSVPALFTNSTYRSEFYAAFADFKTGKFVGVENPGLYDGLPADMKDSDFHKHSLAYARVKDYIDDVITKTVAIMSYDGITQNNNVASIFATDAPVESYFYYKDSSYTTENVPDVDFVQMTRTYSNTPVTQDVIYYVGVIGDVQNTTVYNDNKDFFEIIQQSTFDESPLQYRVIQPNERGYIAGRTTYYKYDAIPYATTNDKYDLYVIDDDVTESEKATYDSLFVKTITTAEYEADRQNAYKLSTTTYKNTYLQDLYFYVKVPYSAANGGDKFFKLLTNNYVEETFKKFCEFFSVPGATQGTRESRLYLKIRTNENYIVYMDKTENPKVNTNFDLDKDGYIDASEFKMANPTYGYKVVNIDLASGKDEYGESISREELFDVTTSYSSYYNSGYKLYFKKVKVNYQELVTDDSAYLKDGSGNYVYETSKTPKISYELNENLPSASYETNALGRVIYALSSEASVTIGETIFNNTVTQELLDAEVNRNFFVEVPNAVYKKYYGDSAVTTRLFYKHTKQIGAKQVYVLDDTKTAANNEVYKNLGYKVITSEEYKLESNFKNFVSVTTSDADYNTNFKLYYKYNTALDHSQIFVQNDIRKANAVYVIDDSLTYSDKATYSANLYTVLTTDEFNAESKFYVQIGEHDPNYSTQYTKLYYRYQSSGAKENLVYLYSTNKSDKYKIFSGSDENYVPTDYKLVERLLSDGSVNPDYVEGLELYYKKVRSEKYSDIAQKTYYYYKSTSAMTLAANSYYAVQFYVNTTGENVQASFYLNDANENIDEIKLEHISTFNNETKKGEWVKYVMFIATDSLASSSVTLSMYLGDKTSIAGNTGASTITGSILFDDIKVLTINQTDYNKRAIDEKVVEATETTTSKNEDETEHTETIDVVLVNDVFTSNTYDYKTKTTVDVKNAESWEKMFNFDNADLTKYFNETKLKSLVADEYGVVDYDGFTPYSDIWQYYISRSNSSMGNDFELKQYQQAFLNNELLAEVVEESKVDKTVEPEETDEDEEETKKEEDKKEDDKKTEDKADVKIVPSTFNKDNYALKLTNKNRLISLGITSNYFTLKQYEYYKITVWVLSTERDATATITLNSVLNTANAPVNGTLLSVSASANACLDTYKTAPTNEYSWIPLTIYVEGNTMHDQDCSLVLSAGKNSTIYFDNITIENISSSAYDTASSDSDEKTQVLSLTPSTSYITNGITNGYFNNITLTSNYKTPDYDFYAPKAAKNWTTNSANSKSVVAGIVPTTKSYTDGTDNDFYFKHNNNNIPYDYRYGLNGTNSYENVYAIYAKPTMDSTIKDAYETNVSTLNSYKIYTSSITLSASSTYKVSFDFQAGYQFDGKLVANLYYGSVEATKIISSFSIDSEDIAGETWNTYAFYVTTSTTSASVYLEIGVESATGTAFFKNAASVTEKRTLDEIRNDFILDSENTDQTTSNLFEKDSLSKVRFLDFSTLNSTIHGNNKNSETNTYDVKEYSTSLTTGTAYSVGKTGVAVASFYDEESVKTTYSVTINKVVYYIGANYLEDGTLSHYGLYKYSDCCPDDQVEEIDGLKVFVDSFDKVTVGEDDSATEYTSTETDKTTYLYTFKDDVTINHINIPASELNNKYSESVMILANSYNTDYINLAPVYTSTLNKTSFLVLKVYVKTSSFNNDKFGLNIAIDSISTKWENIDTTLVSGDSVDENGFVCYQTLIKTADSSITSFGVKFSLGNEKSTAAGYAIIAGIELESFADEASFDHYATSVEDDETTVKKYYANKTSTSEEEKAGEEENMSWATFFYIFSSLLLVLTIAIAIVAVILKKHPIKRSKKVQNDHERDAELIQTTKTKKVNAKTAKAKEEDIDDGNDGIV